MKRQQTALETKTIIAATTCIHEVHSTIARRPFHPVQSRLSLWPKLRAMMHYTCTSCPPESDSLHDDVRQGRISEPDRKEPEREEKNPPSNGLLVVSNW